MKKYAIIQAQVLCTPYIKSTDAETAEDLVKDMGNIGETMPEGPLMVIDFDNRRVLRVSLDDDGNPVEEPEDEAVEVSEAEDPEEEAEAEEEKPKATPKKKATKAKTPRKKAQPKAKVEEEEPETGEEESEEAEEASEE